MKQFISVIIVCVLLSISSQVFANNELGVIYLERGEYDKAFAQFKQVGNAESYFHIGYMLHEGLGFKKDVVTARSWFYNSAIGGYPRSEYIVASYYMQGEGVLQNHDEAFLWMKKSAEKGYDKAQFTLGIMYEKGAGVPQEHEKAMFWWQEAAKNGNRQAKELLKALK